MSIPRKIPTPGQVFNSLTFLYDLNRRDSSGNPLGMFKCTCGVEKAMRITRVVAGTKSCGCQAGANLRLAYTTHGMSKTRVFHIWQNMKYRCEKVGSKDYARYGAKGITVSEEWQDFKTFYADMGEPPSSKHTLDRLEGTEGYSKANCRWATAVEQANNQITNVKYDYKGDKLTAPQLYVLLNPEISLEGFKYRLKAGLSIQEACLPTRAYGGNRLNYTKQTENTDASSK